MKTIGLIGGVASGKSSAAKMLCDFGAGILDADSAGHEVLASDVEVQAALRERWGDDIFTGDGAINRREIARRVFSDSKESAAEREFLEKLLHPRIRTQLELLRNRYATENKPAVVLDAPLLLEAGWGPMCDLILMIDTDRKTRLERARNRGWTDAHFAEREAAQMPVDEKRSAADVIIPNNGSEAELREALRQIWYGVITDRK